jgi:hypothetical protein
LTRVVFWLARLRQLWCAQMSHRQHIRHYFGSGSGKSFQVAGRWLSWGTSLSRSWICMNVVSARASGPPLFRSRWKTVSRLSHIRFGVDAPQGGTSHCIDTSASQAPQRLHVRARSRRGPRNPLSTSGSTSTAWRQRLHVIRATLTTFGHSAEGVEASPVCVHAVVAAMRYCKALGSGPENNKWPPQKT